MLSSILIPDVTCATYSRVWNSFDEHLHLNGNIISVFIHYLLWMWKKECVSEIKERGGTKREREKKRERKGEGDREREGEKEKDGEREREVKMKRACKFQGIYVEKFNRITLTYKIRNANTESSYLKTTIIVYFQWNWKRNEQSCVELWKRYPKLASTPSDTRVRKFQHFVTGENYITAWLNL